MIKLKTFFLALVLFPIIDVIWLGFIAKNFYRQHLGDLMKPITETSQVLSAVGVYLCLALGLLLFVLKDPSHSSPWKEGALFGLVVYGVYDFTNFALVKGWPSALVFVDIIWGAFLCGLVAFLITLF